MSENRVQELMKKNAPWFMFDFHPLRLAKEVSEEEEEIEKEMNEETET